MTYYLYCIYRLLSQLNKVVDGIITHEQESLMDIRDEIPRQIIQDSPIEYNSSHKLSHQISNSGNTAASNNASNDLLSKLLFADNNVESADPSRLNSPETESHRIPSATLHEPHKLSLFSIVSNNNMYWYITYAIKLYMDIDI